MKKRSLWLITALMTLALLGVFVMQLYYIRESYKLKSELFEQDVKQAITEVINKVQRQNVALHIDKKDLEIKTKKANDIKSRTDTIVAFKVKYRENENLRKFKQQQQVINYLNSQDSAIRENYLNPEIISEERFKVYSNPDPNSQRSKSIDILVEDLRDPATGKIINRRVRSVTDRKKPELQAGKLPDTIRYLAFSPQDGLPKLISLPSVDPDLLPKFRIEDAKAEKKYQMELERLYADTITLANNGSLNLVQDVAKELENKDIPLVNRIPRRDKLDTLIKKELINKNINIDYDFWVKLANKDSLIYQNAANGDKELLPKNVYRFPLFNKDIIRDPGMLYVYFPKKSSLIIENMFATLASSAGLLLVLLFIFAYTIYAIIRQKKLSEMKTDFINNMTHEFKTPVATIMIASEALKDPEITSDKTRISRLAGIIYDENVRLGNHIERVLSVARLEKKEIKLEFNPVKVNELVTAVVDSMSLQLQKRDAEITLDLGATQDTIMGDELHLSNVIYNLIDNANKYSSATPVIDITTRSNSKHLYLEVKDHGIGMTKDQTKRIFDQFYRVPTGNLHDVKGFGLGLNYVQDIVTEMGGTIKVHSEKDKGTTFEVILPFKHK
jgi:two-component system phosphate regulon sensor histidine kinase PhoR